MSLEGRFRGKLLLIVLLLCATLGAQANSLTAEQESHHGVGSTAAGCVTSARSQSCPQQPSQSQLPTSTAVWVPPCDAVGVPREVLLAAAPSRAPPA